MEGKLVFLIRSLHLGGAERQLVTLAKSLHARGRPVCVVLFYNEGVLRKDLDAAGVPVFAANKKHRWDFGGFLKRMIHILRTEQPDVLHAYLTTSNILAALLKPLLPKVRIVWGIRASNMNLDYYDRFVRFTNWLESRLSGIPDLMIANSHAGRSHCLQIGFPVEKIKVIPNGIDTERFQPNKSAGRAMRQKWQIEDGTKIIGLAARIDPIKDHTTFLQAASVLLKSRKGIGFVCVGKGAEDYTNQLKTLCSDLGIVEHIHWVGAVLEMEDAYNAFDIATLTSYGGEGFPNVVGEAMACETPCVVTDSGDAAWVVGETGAVVPPQSPEALASAWGEMLDADVQALGSAARARILENYSITRLVTETERLLWHKE